MTRSYPPRQSGGHTNSRGSPEIRGARRRRSHPITSDWTGSCGSPPCPIILSIPGSFIFSESFSRLTRIPWDYCAAIRSAAARPVGSEHSYTNTSLHPLKNSARRATGGLGACPLPTFRRYPCTTEPSGSFPKAKAGYEGGVCRWLGSQRPYGGNRARARGGESYRAGSPVNVRRGSALFGIDASGVPTRPLLRRSSARGQLADLRAVPSRGTWPGVDSPPDPICPSSQQ